MFSKFFIDRPIFASVLSIIITLAGSIALLVLPIAQYRGMATIRDKLGHCLGHSDVPATTPAQPALLAAPRDASAAAASSDDPPSLLSSTVRLFVSFSLFCPW